jgi:hypothetical protein
MERCSHHNKMDPEPKCTNIGIYLNRHMRRRGTLRDPEGESLGCPLTASF